MALSDLVVKSAPLPDKGQRCLWDGKLPGFGLRLSQGGTRTFILKYGNRFITLGRYPILTLQDARGEARRMLAEFTLGRLRPKSLTYPAAVQLFLEERSPHLRPASVKSYRHFLGRLAFDQLATITQHDIARALKPFASTPSEHNQTVATLKVFFGWCIKREFLTDNPARHLSTFQTQSRARVLTDAELHSIWQACDNGGRSSAAQSPPALPASFATIVRLLILTGQRRGEIAALQISWIQNDIITLPSAVTKNKREHTFPIGAFCAELLSQTLKNTPPTSGLIFSSTTITTKPFNNWEKPKAALDEISGVEDWTLHDLRRTFATRLAELAVPPHVIERLINHVSGTISGVSAVYNRASYLAEMRAAIELYEVHLKRLLDLT